MNDNDDGIRRLLHALAAGETSAHHAVCLEALPEFVEAEMDGKGVARLFPEAQAHLDICPECGALHAEMLDVLMAEEAGTIPEPAHLPPAVLPRELRLRHWARNAAGAALDAIKASRAALDGVSQAFFDLLAETQERLEPQEVSVAFALGQADSEALPFVMAAYYAIGDLAREAQQSGLNLRALADSGQLQSLLERIARDEAKRYRLPRQTAQVFVASFVTFALSDLPLLLDLTSASPPASDSAPSN